MNVDGHPQSKPVNDIDCDSLHEVELCIERLHRAHGHLVAFHHNIGRGMNHLAAAEQGLRDAGHRDIADTIRDNYLPRGVIAGDGSPDPIDGRWSYDILENFEDVFLTDIVDYGREIHERLSGGARHVAEREQERAWKGRVHRD